MNKVISKEEALDTLVRLARMKDKEFDLNEMGNIDAIEKSYLILNQALVLDKDIEEALKYSQGSSIHNDDIYAQESLSAIKLALQSIPITSDEIVKDFLMENKDD